MINLRLLMISTLKNQNHTYQNSFMDKNAENTIKKNTCFKNELNPSCIDLFIINSPLSFQNTIAFSNRLSNFHNMVITVMKMTFKKHSPIERHYRDWDILIRSNLKMT